MTTVLILAFGIAAIALAWIMLETMSMMKAGLALMGSSLAVAGLLVLLHADLIAAMTVMMFGPAMIGMILFMLMLMEDPGGFMMTSDDNVESDRHSLDIEPAVLALSDGLLEPIDAIAPSAGKMDMAMTNQFLRPGAIAAIGFFLFSAFVIIASPWQFRTGQPPPQQTLQIGEALLNRYMVAFEGSALLILLAIVGATMLGRKEIADR